MQLYADIYLLLNYSTCFGRPSHPSSGVHKTVVAASGTDHTIWVARQYDLYQRLQLQFQVLVMTGAMDARNYQSNLAVNKYLHTAASCWIPSTKSSACSSHYLPRLKYLFQRPILQHTKTVTISFRTSGNFPHPSSIIEKEDLFSEHYHLQFFDYSTGITETILNSSKCFVILIFSFRRCNSVALVFLQQDYLSLAVVSQFFWGGWGDTCY